MDFLQLLSSMVDIGARKSIQALKRYSSFSLEFASSKSLPYGLFVQTSVEICSLFMTDKPFFSFFFLLILYNWVFFVLHYSTINVVHICRHSFSSLIVCIKYKLLGHLLEMYQMTLCVSQYYFMLNLKASTGCEKIGRQKWPVSLCSIIYVTQVSVVPLKFKPELWEYPTYSNVDYMYFFVMCVHWGRKKKNPVLNISILSLPFPFRKVIL